MIDELATLVEAIDDAAHDVRRLDALLAALVEGKSKLFSCALLFKGGYAGGPFVLVADYGSSSRSVHSWLRWPLRRLFARMKPSRVLNPVDHRSCALALPFAYGTQRYVALALISERAASAKCADFLRVLESMTLNQVPLAIRSSAAPATPMNPPLAAFGMCAPLRDRIDRVLAHRGWSCEHFPDFDKLWRSLDAAPAVLAVDTHAIDEPLAAITTIHRVADSGSLRLLAIGDKLPDSVWTRPLIDRFLPHDANGDALFTTLKELARDSGLADQGAGDQSDTIAARQVSNCLSLQELAGFGAKYAAKLMHGWAHCVLVNEHGVVDRAEYPASEPPVLSKIPKAFLTDTAVFDLRVSDRFLREISDDPFEQMALTALQPISGAAVPIASALGTRAGALVACSRSGWVSSATFESIERLCRALAVRCDELQARRPNLPEFRHEQLWDRVRDRWLGLDIYRSSDCSTSWRYRVIGESSALLTLGVSDDGVLYQRLTDGAALTNPDVIQSLAATTGGSPSFAAAIEFSNESMSYVTQGFSPPILLNRHRPATSIRSFGTMTSGSAALGASDEAVVCDLNLWRWLSERGNIERLRPLLDRETPPGLASIVTLGSPR